ncbi:DEAD/DEAH box helicase [Chitinophaga sedimenti]|nr:DEAD/DEAH box helicase [Chitinophaga sedimenti]MCK7559202.1 DEAD/DEAH box helicase [Chitinophaga sedimenti]
MERFFYPLKVSVFLSRFGFTCFHTTKILGYDQFRPLQEDIVNSVLNGHDTLALLPTGGGKSICFQVPAMMLDGICLVVTPLIALMKDRYKTWRSAAFPPWLFMPVCFLRMWKR